MMQELPYSRKLGKFIEPYKAEITEKYEKDTAWSLRSLVASWITIAEVCQDDHLRQHFPQLMHLTGRYNALMEHMKNHPELVAPLWDSMSPMIQGVFPTIDMAELDIQVHPERPTNE